MYRISRLPLKHGSDWHETLPKRVSDDSRQLNFRRKKNVSTIFGPNWSRRRDINFQKFPRRARRRRRRRRRLVVDRRRRRRRGRWHGGAVKLQAPRLLNIPK